MIEQKADDKLPPAESESQQRQHRRTTSAAASFNSLPHTHSHSNSSTDELTAAVTHKFAAPRPAHNRRHGASNSASYEIDQNAAPLNGPVIRGRDWESIYNPHAKKVQSTPPDLRKLLRRTGISQDVQEQQPKSASAIRYSRSLSESPSAHHHNYTAAVPAASLSEIMPVYMLSPTYPFQKLSQSSPTSVGPQSGETIPAEPAAPTGPPSPDHNDLPKYGSAFDYAMKPFLGAFIDDSHEKEVRLPPPVHQEARVGPASPIFLPLQDDASTSYDSDEEEDDIPEYGIPSHLFEKDAFRTRMRHIQLRTYLMQCTILHNTVGQIQRKPWRSGKEHSPRWYYEKMCSLAGKARPLAEALESRDLQARCAYWQGRGCGGTRDYQAAEAHFKRALLLDEPNDTSPKGRPRLRGLLPTEKADVRFLLDSCTARHRSWEKRMKVAMQWAQNQSDATGLPIEACLDDNVATSPAWVPDRDRIVQLARSAFDGTGKTVQGSVDWQRGQTLEDELQARWKHEDEDVQAMKKRTLSKKELQYIKHGDAKVREQRARQLSIDEAAKDTPTLRKQPSASSGRSSRAASGNLSLRRPQTLANELAGLEWPNTPPGQTPTLSQYSNPSEVPSPAFSDQPLAIHLVPSHDQDQSSTDPTSSTPFLRASIPTDLQQCRNIHLDPIITDISPLPVPTSETISAKHSSGPCHEPSDLLPPGPSLPLRGRSVSTGAFQSTELMASPISVNPYRSLPVSPNGRVSLARRLRRAGGGSEDVDDVSAGGAKKWE
jgi:hypothetical protein